MLCPKITVVFQKDLSDNEELCKEIADMYITRRAYYYSGSDAKFELSEKDNDAFIKFEDIDFNQLQKIDF